MRIESTTRYEALEQARELLHESKHVESRQTTKEELIALSNLMEEVCFHLDRLQAFSPRLLEQWRQART